MSDEQAALDAMDSVEPGGEAAPAEAGQVVEEAPFHSYKWDDGKEDVWKTPDELNDFIRSGTLRHSDYTRKTQQAAETRKHFEQKLKDYEAKERTFNESYGDIMKYDKFLRENPQVKERIAAEMSGTLRDNDLDRLLDQKIQEKYGEKFARLDEIDQKEAERAEQEAREKAFDSLSGRYQDFDRDAISAAIQKLNETPEEMRLEAALEAMYFANKGRSNIAEIERKTAQKASKPRAAPTASVEVPEGKTPKGREEEMELALAAMEAASGK